MRDRRGDVCRIVERSQVDEVRPIRKRPAELQAASSASRVLPVPPGR